MLPACATRPRRRCPRCARRRRSAARSPARATASKRRTTRLTRWSRACAPRSSASSRSSRRRSPERGSRLSFRSVPEAIQKASYAMAVSHLDRLSATDASFLSQENESAHMHIGGVCVFEGPPPSYAELAEHVEARLHLVPRYRQKLAFPPLQSGR